MVQADLEKLVHLWFSTHRVLRERVQSDHKLDPMSVVRMETLRQVADNPKISMREVAGCFGIRPSSATSLVNGLVKSGDLSRRHDPRDRRVVHLTLTLRGKKNLQRTRRIMQAKLSGLLSSLSEKERQSLLSIFQKLTLPSYKR